MAENKSTTKKKEDRLKIRLFKDDGKYKDPVYVGLNGKGYLIERGVDVELPRGVYEILKNSQEQVLAATEMTDELSSKSKETE